MNAHDLRDERRDGLAKRRSFSLNAAHAPGKHANAIAVVVWESVPTTVSKYASSPRRSPSS